MPAPDGTACPDWQGCASPSLPLLPSPVQFRWPLTPKVTPSLRTAACPPFRTPGLFATLDSHRHRSLDSIQKTHLLTWDWRVPLTLQLSLDAQVIGAEPGGHGRARDGASSGAGPPSWLLGSVRPNCCLRRLGPRLLRSLSGSPAAEQPKAAGNLAVLFWERAEPRDAGQQLTCQSLWFPRCSSPL